MQNKNLTAIGLTVFQEGVAPLTCQVKHKMTQSYAALPFLGKGGMTNNAQNIREMTLASLK